MNTAATGRSGFHRAAPARTAGQWSVQIIGELLLTLGFILLLFVAWQLWWTNIAANSAQQDAVSSLTQEFKQAAASALSDASGQVEDGGTSTDNANSADPASTDTVNFDPTNPPVATGADAYGQAYGVIYIPRLGESYQRPIAEGTGNDVLDTLGLGHYEGTAQPGEVGNFALAGHRQTNGAVLDRIDKLQNGDKIYVQTIDGYYTYTVYQSHIVLPHQVEVIAPVPNEPGAEATERTLTLTTCHPRYGDTERYIVHASFDGWQPLAAGAPQDIASTVEGS
ncbi:class E sortase [Rothia sp. ZJ932]|uniref:class E sortase n=1 Tax=Rothia sp. ZJ932 TaxID=2810516 RepID=UPI00196764B4|nr:class E sortase [Rothia sp. ZJ932]QRZ61531.1 class E sortase [Rothia sp. ZJ932]